MKLARYGLFAVLAMTAFPAFAAVNLGIENLVQIVVYLLVVGGIFWLLLWLIGYFGLPEPFAKIAKGIIMIVGVLILINILLGFVGSPIVNFR